MAKSKMQRDSVVFYRSFYEAVRELEPAQQAEVYNAVFEFGLNGVEPKMTGIAKSIFTLIKPQILANNARYLNGQKGGRPKKDETENEPSDEENHRESEPTSNQKETEQKPKQNLDETENEPKTIHSETKTKPNENDNVNVNDIILGLDRMDLESSIQCSEMRARDKRNAIFEVVRKHLCETLQVKWLRQQIEGSETLRDRLCLFDEYVEILESADTQKKANALLSLDGEKFTKLFNALYQGDEEIANKYRYVWKSVFAYAKETTA